jgi:Flp pilus assembly pilin Flp
MQRIRNFVASLERDQRGLTTVEYAIVLCVIVAVAVGTWDSFGTALVDRLIIDTDAITKALVPGG